MRGGQERLLDVYDDDLTVDGALSNMEERALLERAGYEGAEIEIDAGQAGPLYQYALARRELAKEQIMTLVMADPKDAVAIASAQMGIQEYLRVARWARGRIERAVQAEKQVEEAYGDDSKYED